MKALLVTYMNSTNIGDQLIASAFEDLISPRAELIKYDYGLTIKQQVKKSNELVAEKPKSYFRKFYAKYIRNLYLVDTTHRIVNNLREKNKPEWKRYTNDLSKCDVLIIGGGNAIFDVTPQSLSAYYFNLHVEKAKKLNKKVFVVSIGLGPFKTQKQIEYTRKTLQKCDYVTFRDEKSMGYLIDPSLEGENNMYLSIDPVYLLKKTEKVVNSQQTIAICVIDYRLTRASDKEYIRYIQTLSILIDELIKVTGHPVVLYSTEIIDYPAVKDVFELIKNKNDVSIMEIYSVQELLDFYASVSLVLGTRMHSMIIAISQYIPVVGLSWQQKVTEMFEIIDDQESVFDIKNMDLYKEEIINRCNEKLINSKVEREKLVKFKGEAINKFEVNHQIMAELQKDISYGR